MTSKAKRCIAVTLSALLLTGTAALAQYPEPERQEDGSYRYSIGQTAEQLDLNTDGFPSKLQGVGSENAFIERWNATSNITEYSTAEKRFTIDGKHFLLLDTDGDGNYFVIADDLYGTRSYITTVRNDSQDPSNEWAQVFYNGTWKYDPENEISIAHWLNNAFLTSGNGGNMLPEGIVENLVEKEWGIEGGTKIEDQYFYKFCDTQNNPPQPKYSGVAPYVVTQKISLLSATEYWAYYEDISPLVYGAEPFGASAPWNYQAWSLRTSVNVPITIQTGMQALYIEAGKGKRIGSNMYNALGIRPCFWLESDFFREVRLDAEGETLLAGDFVKDTIKNTYAKADMAQLYDTQTLINQLGYPEFAPLAAQEPDILGNAAVGATQTASYVFAHESSSFTEGDSQYQWYVSNDDGSFVKIDGATERTYVPPADFEGKQLKVSIRCADDQGSLAPLAFTPETAPLRPRQEVSGEFAGITNADGSAFTGDGVKISFRVNSSGEKNMCILMGTYDANGKLTGIKIEEVAVKAGDSVVCVSSDTFNGSRVKAVLVDSKDSLRPFAVADCSK